MLVAKEMRNLSRLLRASLKIRIEDPLTIHIMKLLVEILSLGKVGEFFLQNVLEDLWITTHGGIKVALPWTPEHMYPFIVSQYIYTPIV